MLANLCIDIGNSRVKMAIFEADEMIDQVVMAHSEISQINEWLGTKNYTRAIYSSVFTDLPKWLHELNIHTNLTGLRFNLKLPLHIQYENPERLGTDRIAAMVGALQIFQATPILVVNAGSCITYDLVSADAVFLGGNIAPGLNMRLKAMHEFTAALPLVEADLNYNGFLGKNTRSAMLGGAIQGIVMETEGYIQKLGKEYTGLKCLITGGDLAFLVNHLKSSIFAEPYLVLKGLNTILNNQ